MCLTPFQKDLFFCFCFLARRVLVPFNQALNPCLLQGKHGVLTTGLPGKPLQQDLNCLTANIHSNYNKYLLSIYYELAQPSEGCDVREPALKEFVTRNTWIE